MPPTGLSPTPLCALHYLNEKRTSRHNDVPMLKEPTWWADASIGLRANLGSKSGSAVSSVHGLRQVNVPLCTQFSHMCKGVDQTQSHGVGVRVK